MNGDELDVEPTELTTLKSNTPTDSLLPKPYTTIKYVDDTLKTRAIMVSMSAASSITDASLEAAGY
jgi:hypothetical protein